MSLSLCVFVCVCVCGIGRSIALSQSEEVRVDILAEDATGSTPLMVANETNHDEAMDAIEEGLRDRIR